MYGLLLDPKMQPFWRIKPVENFSAVPLAGAGCLAIRREAYFAVGGFDGGFRGVGYADIDLCFRLWTFGYNIYLDPSIRVMHKFRKSRPYRVVPHHLTCNYLRWAFKNFNENRITRVIDSVKDTPGFGSILTDVLVSDVWEQRIALHSRRKHDDDWFCDRFSLDI